MILKRENGLEKLIELIPVLVNQNSQKAWSEFVQITGNDLHRYICYYLHDAEYASDTLQDVYISFLRNKEIFKKICLNDAEEVAVKKIYAWLYKTSRNKSLDHIKKNKNGIAAKLFLSDKSPSREFPMPTNDLEKKESNELIKYELSQLNEKQQNLLTLKFFHEKSNLEIAREINCQVISVPKLIDRALTQLKKRLEKVGVILSLVMIGESLSNKAMCVDMPAYLLPEVFQLYESSLSGGLLTKTLSLKGILMKSLYTIVGATIVSTFVFYIKTPSQDKIKNETPKELIVENKKNPPLKIVNNDLAEPTKVEPVLAKGLNGSNEKNTISVSNIRTFQLEAPVVTFRINSVSQLMSDYKNSPYFQFANSSATGLDFERIDFSKIYDLYNDGILDLSADSMVFKNLFSMIGAAESCEYQSNLKTSFVIRFDFDSVESAQLKNEYITKWLQNKIQNLKVYYAEKEENLKNELEKSNQGKNYSVKISGSFVDLFNTKVELVGKSLYVINGAKELTSEKKYLNANSNITLLLNLDQVVLENPIIKILSEIFNVNTSEPIQVTYDFNSSGLAENIAFQTKDAEKVFFDKAILTTPIKDFITSQNSSDKLFTNIKPSYIYPFVKLIGPYVDENFDQMLILGNLLCFQKYQKSIESLLNESLSGELCVKMSDENIQIMLGLTKENKISSILEKLENDMGLPFEWQIIENKYLKITMDSIFNIKEKGNNHWEKFAQEDLYLLGAFSTQTIFQEPIQERLRLVQKYSTADANIKDCLPLLTNEQIFNQFNNLSVGLTISDLKGNLKINSPIPYLFGYLFFQNMEISPSKISVTDEAEDKNTQEPIVKKSEKVDDRSNDSSFTRVINAVDGTLFLKVVGKNSEIDEKFIYGEKNQVELSYKKDPESDLYVVKRFSAENKLIESYFELENKKNGEFKEFDKNGTLLQKGLFKNGLKTGPWFFYQGEEVLSEIKYEDNFPTNSFERKFPGGGVEIKVTLDSKGNGSGKNYFRNGQIKLEGDYVNFKRVNCWKVYYDNGHLQAEIYYNFFGEKQKVITFYNTQDKHFEVPYKGDLIDGKVLELYPLGKIKGEYLISKGNPTPPWIFYNNDGSVSGEWALDGTYTGILKEIDKKKDYMEYSLFIDGSTSVDNNVKLNHVALEIETRLNILYSRNSEIIIESSVNGPFVSSIPELLPHLNLRGESVGEVCVGYGYVSDKNQIKESILFQINSWNNQLVDFVNDSTKNHCFLMNDHIIYKFFIQDKKVKSLEYLEYSGELF